MTGDPAMIINNLTTIYYHYLSQRLEKRIQTQSTTDLTLISCYYQKQRVEKRVQRFFRIG